MISESSVAAILPAQGWLRKYVDWACRCTDAHSLYNVGVALSLLTQAVPRELFGPFGVDVKANLYTMLVGESSESRKTISIMLGVDQVLRPSQICQLGETPGSHEALVDELIVQPKKLILYPEFGSFLSAVQRSYMQPLKTAYCEAYDNSPLARQTVSGKKAKPGAATRVEDPRLSVLCGISPPLLEAHTDVTDWNGGFISRFLMFYCTREREMLEFKSDKAGATELAEGLALMNAAGLGTLDLITGKNAAWGPCDGLDTQAKLLWRSWRKQVNEKIKKSPLEVRGALSRAATAALKISLLLGWDYGGARKSTNPWCVGEAELAPAISITNFHIESVTELSSTMAISIPMRERRIVLELIRGKEWPRPRSPAVSFGELITESHFMAKKVREHIDSLEAENMIMRVSGQGECYSGADPIAERIRKSTFLDLNATLPAGATAAAPKPLIIGSGPAVGSKPLATVTDINSRRLATPPTVNPGLAPGASFKEPMVYDSDPIGSYYPEKRPPDGEG